MLTLGGEPFTSGRMRFDDTLPGATVAPRIVIKIQPSGLDMPIRAQLDTGAEWSVLERDIAENLGLLDASGPSVRYTTRLGTFEGRLVKHTVTLLADEGDSLDVNATLLVSSEWTAHSFLGYRGLLETIRFALDPQNNTFYFGEP